MASLPAMTITILPVEGQRALANAVGQFLAAGHLRKSAPAP